jgi:hypothetical protein
MAHEKVWDSCFLKDPSNGTDVTLHLPGSDEYPDPLAQSVDFAKRYSYVLLANQLGSHQDINVDEYPDYMYHSYKGSAKPLSQSKDLFKAKNGLLVASGAMFDLLQEFNIGATRLHHVPMRKHDQKTPVEGRWYFLHIRENRNCLIPERSTGVERIMVTDLWAVKSDSWSRDPNETFQLCVDPTEAGDLDLWRDSRAQNVVFFSDRLKEAITKAGLSFKSGNDFRACKVV